MLCLEYMVNGDLRTFLRQCRPNLEEKRKAVIDGVVMCQMVGERAAKQSERGQFP